MKSGLGEFFSSFNNSVSINLSTNNTIDDIKAAIENGERLGSILLNSCKFEMQLSLYKEIGSKLKEIFSTIDPDFANSPPFLLLKYFKSLDIDMKFNSTSELPELIRKKVFFGKKLADMLPE